MSELETLKLQRKVARAWADRPSSYWSNVDERREAETAAVEADRLYFAALLAARL